MRADGLAQNFGSACFFLPVAGAGLQHPGRLQLELPAFPRLHLRAALPCTIAMDCNVAGAANPVGGPGLTCGTESLPDGGMSLARFRGAGMCFDDAQCAQPTGSPA